MPDWNALVSEQLAGLALEPRESAEVIAEVAAHLEDICEELLRQGMTEDAAVRRALSQVGHWQNFKRNIVLARTMEKTMTPRVVQFWLPGLLTFLVSMVLLELVQKVGPKPIILGLDKGIPILMFYTGWLVMLPLAGALGAYLSHRARGSFRIALASSLFPVLPLVVVFLTAIPIGLAMGHGLMPKVFLNISVEWVLLPAVALLMGGLPTQLFVSRRQV
ncbi:MAG: permease prefix domain 1-containing protein [Candidatus Acidiferrum sp.]